MKTNERHFYDIVVPYGTPEEVRPAVSRGTILSGALEGLCSYTSRPVIADTSPVDNEPDIEYIPENDQRLDRFDAMEMAIDVMDKAVPTPDPSGHEEKE